jgi:hypothetical protein
MRKLVIVPILLLFATAAGQTNRTAPITWERYRLADKVSVMLPKLPMMWETRETCHELKKVTYFAYADGVVYEVAVIKKETLPGTILGCPEKTVFGERSIERRLERLRDRGSEDPETKSTVSGFEAYNLKTPGSTRTLISDIAKNKRWIELAVHHSTKNESNFDRFFSSVEIGSKTGKDVGKGAKAVLGDPIATTSPAPTTIDHSADLEQARVIFRPFPRLTARVINSKSTGAVKLKIELKANGTVGNVTAVEEMEEMTKSAIEAARSMVFLPMRVNGVPTDSSTTFDFRFSIDSAVISNRR